MKILTCLDSTLWIGVFSSDVKGKVASNEVGVPDVNTCTPGITLGQCLWKVQACKLSPGIISVRLSLGLGESLLSPESYRY